MILFAEYFAEHSIHTLKLSLIGDADPSELTNLLRRFESINVRKLEIEVGRDFISQITQIHTGEQEKIGDELFVAILKAFWNANLDCLKIPEVRLTRENIFNC